MQTFDIVKSCKINASFRNQYVKSKFDIQKENIIETFKGELNLDFDWNVGIIVGTSGTGKTTIAKQLFGEFEDLQYGKKSIIDEMKTDDSVDEIISVFNKVGFSSPPSWLKPYDVLSNGEKMRVDLARNILERKEKIIFDEFTSVVDRNIAKIGSHAVQKYVRKNNKQFVAISCHFDILDWLEPDWVFDTNKMFFFAKNMNDQKSKLKLENAIIPYGRFLENIII